MVTETALWQAINAYDLDAADAALPFSRRLARETGWTQDFALRAIAEYKAFMYLICVSDTMLTPSEEVDQVWHLHLIYTRDYWDRFCATVLKRRVHHGPTQGGEAEDLRFLDAYERTRQLYAETFGRQPPSDLWPEPAIRFRPVRTPRNPDLSDKIILPKRQVFLCLIAGAAAVALSGCTGEVDKVWAGHLLIWVPVAALWLVITLLNASKIIRRGIVAYLLGGLVFMPIFTLIIYRIVALAGSSVHHDPGLEPDMAIAAAISVPLWLRSHLTPSKGGSGSGCGGGASCGSDGGHGCGSGCGGGGGCGGGCGGH